MSQRNPIDASYTVPPQSGTYNEDGTDQISSNTVIVSEARTLKVFEQNVHVTGAVAVTLPAVGEAQGNMYVISAAAAGSVTDQNDSYGWSGVTLTVGDVWLFVSNGIGWTAIIGNDTD